MKQSFKALIICAAVFIFNSICANAFSADITDVLDMYTVGSYGSTTPKTTFDLDETPFLYTHLKIDEAHRINGYWVSPLGIASGQLYLFNSDNAAPFTPINFITGNDHWFSFDQSYNMGDGSPALWDTKKMYGDWSVFGTVEFEKTGLFEPTTTFTVTPEPTTIVLFGLGGFALLTNTRRRRKAKSS